MESVERSAKSSENAIKNERKVCGGCQITGPEPVVTCTQGHLLCQQCVRRFTIRSDVGCVVCGADLHNSNSSCSRESSLNRMDGRSSPRQRWGIRGRPPVEELHINPWFRGYGLSKISGNNIAPYNSFDGVGGSCSEGEGDLVESDELGELCDKGENRVNRDGKHLQQRSYCSIIQRIDPQQQPEYVPDVQPRIKVSAPVGDGASTLVHVECSRRPIRCPRLDCAVNVAFSALTHHFLFDHPEVPILSVEPGAKSTLIVSFAALSCDSSRCLALLLVSGKLLGSAARLFNGNHIHPRYRNRLPLPVLAARLHCSSRYAGHDEDNGHGEGRGEGDIVIAWVAGLDIGSTATGSLRCSIQAMDGGINGGLRSLTYTGPVNSLRTAQRPREVFLTGDCVILHEGLINHITSDCASLNVNVIVH